MISTTRSTLTYSYRPTHVIRRVGCLPSSPLSRQQRETNVPQEGRLTLCDVAHAAAKPLLSSTRLLPPSLNYPKGRNPTKQQTIESEARGRHQPPWPRQASLSPSCLTASSPTTRPAATQGAIHMDSEKRGFSWTEALLSVDSPGHVLERIEVTTLKRVFPPATARRPDLRAWRQRNPGVTLQLRILIELNAHLCVRW
jgi:hypothetical protein